MSEIETRSLSEQVYQWLCARIIEGGIEYGGTVNIKEIAEELHVSPMPVRESVKRLQSEGLVTIKPRSTCIVKIPTKDSILNAIEMREVLEIHCVGRLAGAESGASIERLREIVESMKANLKAASGASRIREYIELDRKLHFEICRSSENEFIEKSYRELSLHLNMQYIYDIAVPPDTARSLADHIALLEALEARSPERAVDILSRHLAQSRRNILKGKMFNSLK